MDYVSGGRFESDVTNALYINDVGEIWSNYLYSQVLIMLGLYFT